jgi:8-oxo-dGTP pyrophosphatase MutT (NUDIX family)
MDFREFIEHKHGAGVLPITESTGKILLGMRTEGVWATWGGGMEEGENPQETAEREFREETGYKGVVSLFPDYVREDPKITFHNFIGIVPDQFTLIINHEHLFADWFSFEQLDELKKHHGLDALLRHSGSKIERISKRHEGKNSNSV